MIHEFLEQLANLLTWWPVRDKKTQGKTVGDRQKIADLRYKPICNISASEPEDKKCSHPVSPREQGQD